MVGHIPSARGKKTKEEVRRREKETKWEGDIDGDRGRHVQLYILPLR